MTPGRRRRLAHAIALESQQLDHAIAYRAGQFQPKRPVAVHFERNARPIPALVLLLGRLHRPHIMGRRHRRHVRSHRPSDARQRFARAGIGELDNAVVLELLGRLAANVGLGPDLRMRVFETARRKHSERRYDVSCRLYGHPPVAQALFPLGFRLDRQTRRQPRPILCTTISSSKPRGRTINSKATSPPKMIMRYPANALMDSSRPMSIRTPSSGPNAVPSPPIKP